MEIRRKYNLLHVKESNVRKLSLLLIDRFLNIRSRRIRYDDSVDLLKNFAFYSRKIQSLRILKLPAFTNLDQKGSTGMDFLPAQYLLVLKVRNGAHRDTR